MIVQLERKYEICAILRFLAKDIQNLFDDFVVL